PKRKATFETTLTDEEQQELRTAVLSFGLKHTNGSATQLAEFAGRFSTTVEAVKAFVKTEVAKEKKKTKTSVPPPSDTAPTSSKSNSEFLSSLSSVAPPLNPASVHGAPSFSIPSPLTVLAEQLHQLIAQHQQSGSTIDGMAANSSMIANDPVKVPKFVEEREANTFSPYYIYQLEEGAKLKESNQAGLEESPTNFQPLNMRMHEAAYKSQNGQSYYQKVKQQVTEEDKLTWARWVRLAAEKTVAYKSGSLNDKELAKNKKQHIDAVVKHIKVLADVHNVQCFGTFFEPSTGESRDISAGEFGVKLSTHFYKSPSTRVPVMFEALHQKKVQRQRTHLVQLKNETAGALVALQNNALTQLNKPTCSVFQIAKLTSAAGFHGVKMIGFPLSPSGYRNRNTRGCNVIKSRLDKIKFELVGRGEVEASGTGAASSKTCGDGNASSDELSAGGSKAQRECENVNNETSGDEENGDDDGDEWDDV
ncbi:hypothetical protein HDU98_001793, partial [Podochytrium sp. JEL0797]